MCNGLFFLYNEHMMNWKNIHKIYLDEMPVILQELIQCPSLQRIDEIDMNCGMQFSSFKLFKNIGSYSRLQHSIGVACIIYYFTQDIVQACAGLFHDISTPVFSHVVDFMMYDHLKQEYTENKITSILKSDSTLISTLKKYDIPLELVDDYHKYPIADNDSPNLSADRLEYTLGNMVNYGFTDVSTLERLYKDLSVTMNEYGEQEICFKSLDLALEFTKYMWMCSSVYIADEDRFGMEYLASLLRDMLERKTCTLEDLYTTEKEFISILNKDPIGKSKFEIFTSFTSVRRCKEKEEGSFKVDAKKRFIDVYVEGKGRISTINSEMKNSILSFQSKKFDYYITGCKEN